MNYVKISNIAVYHPDNAVSNQSYINYFKDKGRDISSFLTKMGKENRYLIHNNEENSLTMAIHAAKKCLKDANLSGKDIDYIVFSTQVPEYTFPTNALLLHKAIEANSHTISFDMNANCAGMTIAVEQTTRYMMGHSSIKRALVVGSDNLSLVSNPEEEITYATYGDAACAVIIEKTEDDAGLVDSIYTTDTRNADKITFPKNGYTDFHQTLTKEKYITFELFDASYGPEIMIEQMEHLLEANQLQITDISTFCISQFAMSDKIKLEKHFDLGEEQVINVGAEYGYTGTSSPFIALEKAIHTGQIKRGDYIIFWTVGAGHQFICMLWKY